MYLLRGQPQSRIGLNEVCAPAPKVYHRVAGTICFHVYELPQSVMMYAVVGIKY